MLLDIPTADIANIIGRFSRKVYITQEVEDTSGSFSGQHAAQGDVNEYAHVLHTFNFPLTLSPKISLRLRLKDGLPVHRYCQFVQHR